MLSCHLSDELFFQWVHLLFEFHLPSEVYRHQLPFDFPPIGEVNGFSSETKFVTGRNLSQRCHERAWPAMGCRMAIPLPIQQAESPALIHPSKSILIGSLKLFYSSVIKEQLSSQPKMN